MPDGWIAGATRINGQKDGDTYRTNVPWRKVWHTMEAPADRPPGTGPWGSIAGLIAYIESHRYPPHIWCWPERDWVGQTVNLYRSAYALVHSWSGYPETNHARAIQTEILGYAQDAPTIEHAEWLGRRVLKPIIDEGIPINLSHWAPSTDSDGAGVNGAVRMSAANWYDFDGQCGHANVPRNEHWDPGRADYARIARAAGAQPPEDDDMANSDEIYKQTTEILKALRYDPKTAGTENEVGLRIKRTDETVADVHRMNTHILQALRYDPAVSDTEDELGARVKRTEEQVAEILAILKTNPTG